MLSTSAFQSFCAYRCWESSAVNVSHEMNTNAIYIILIRILYCQFHMSTHYNSLHTKHLNQENLNPFTCSYKKRTKPHNIKKLQWGASVWFKLSVSPTEGLIVVHELNRSPQGKYGIHYSISSWFQPFGHHFRRSASVQWLCVRQFCNWSTIWGFLPNSVKSRPLVVNKSLGDIYSELF